MAIHTPALPVSNRPAPSTANTRSTMTKIPVKSGKKDVLAELTEMTETAKADQEQHRREGDHWHTEAMTELAGRNTRDNQKHAEKMLDKQIELRKIELRLEKECRKNCKNLRAISGGEPSTISISSASTSAAASQTGSPAVQGHTLPDASGVVALEQHTDFGIGTEVLFMPFNTNSFL
jgi:hypothetical protein